MWNSTSLRLAALLFLLLANCSSFDNFGLPEDSSGAPTVNTIVQRVVCELADLVSGEPNAISYRQELLDKDYQVAVKLELTVNGTGSLATTLTAIRPLTPPQSTSFKADGAFEQSREQKFNQNYFFSMRDVRKLLQSDPKAVACPSADGKLVSGDLGIRSTAELALRADPAYRRTEPAKGLEVGFGGSVQFTVKRTLGPLGPAWALVHFAGSVSLGTASDSKIQKVTFSFAPASQNVNAASKPSGAMLNLNQQLLAE